MFHGSDSEGGAYATKWLRVERRRHCSEGGRSKNVGLECSITREVGQRMAQLRKTREGKYFMKISIVFLRPFRG